MALVDWESSFLFISLIQTIFGIKVLIMFYADLEKILNFKKNEIKKKENQNLLLVKRFKSKQSQLLMHRFH